MAMIRVLMISKACIIGIYQRKLEEIAREGIELLTLVPPSWKDERGETKLERVYTDGYRLEVIPIALNGNFHLHYYPDLGRIMRDFSPQIVHIDEEPYNLSAWQALYHARRTGAKTLFFSWQNINRAYPPPFSWGENWVLHNIDHAIVGTESAGEVWREKGYLGPMSLIPQFGVDPNLFTPRPHADRPFTIGYFGRLVEEKGLDLLFRAAATLTGEWRLRIVGNGPQRAELESLAEELGIRGRIQFCEQIPSVEMPAQYHELDVFVLPSLTKPNWKEQFGRVLIEAMASGVPVIGSDSGAIPDVVGKAGLIFPEGDIEALAEKLGQLQKNHALRIQLAENGRIRVLSHFTHRRVASATVQVYQQMSVSVT
jgi:glycosyltransferase involved in cell wall biosynthesis